MIRKVLSKEATLIFFLCLLLIAVWFHRGSLYAGAEPGIPFYNLDRYFTLVSHLWYDAGTGHPYLSLITGIPFFWLLRILYDGGLSGTVLQSLTFFTLLLTGTFSVFYLVRIIFDQDLITKEKQIVPVVAAVFYILNPFSMTQVWGRGVYGQFFSFALMPLFLLLFVLGVKRRSFFYLTLSVLASFLLSFAFVSPTQVLVLWVPIVFYVIFYLFNKSEEEKSFALKGFLFTLLFWFLTHSWWILTFLKSGRIFYSYFLENPEENLGTLRGVSSYFPLSSVIRLLQKYPLFVAKSYGEIYSTFVFQLMSWFTPLIALFSLSYLKKIKFLRYFGLLFLVGLVVSLGANPPLGEVFVWIFLRAPYLQSFRNPYEKFGLVFALAYTPFFALGVYHLCKKVSKITGNTKSFYFALFAILFLVSGIYVWPMWSGHIAGGFTANAWVRVPSYYKEADLWLAQRIDGKLRVLQVSLIPAEGVRYTWPTTYQGAEPSEFLFTVPSIGRNVIVNKPYYNILLERFDNFHPNIFGPDPDTSGSGFRSQELYQELEKLAVRYIVLHHDLDEKVAGTKTPRETAAFLGAQPNIKKVKSFGELDIYEVDISDNVSRIYSPNNDTNFIRRDPTFYEIEVKDAKGEIEIYFLDLFDPGWEAFIDGERVSEHYRVFDYANAWRINKDGDYKVIIKYKFQEIVYSGMKISLTSLASLILLGFYWWRKQTTH